MLLLIALASPLALAAHGRGSESRQATTLGEAAAEYWEGVRWSSPEKCTKYLPDAETRVALSQLLADPAARLTDATVVQAELGVEPKDASDRTAVVLVRLEVIDLAKNRYETQSYAQHWREVGQSWFVDVAASPFAADRPWGGKPGPGEPGAAASSVSSAPVSTEPATGTPAPEAGTGATGAAPATGTPDASTDAAASSSQAAGH